MRLSGAEQYSRESDRMKSAARGAVRGFHGVFFSGQTNTDIWSTELVSTTTQTDVVQQVMKVVNEVLTLEERDDLLDASFTDELSLSSLERMTLFIALEDEFERDIAQDDIEHIDSLRDVIEFIKTKIGA